MPPDINALLDAANSGLQAIPRENLKTAIDEAYTAVGGLGPQLSDIVKGSTTLAIDARANLDPLINLIDNAKPVLDSQVQTSAAIRAWASHIATVTGELKANNDAVAGVIDQGGLVATNEQARNLIERLKPTLPVIVANLSSIGQVAVTYQNDIEQLLVLLPHAVSEGQATFMANANTNQAYRGEYLSFNLNINLPPACTTGFLPAQQQRIPNLVDYPERPPGDLYCRTPQDSPFNVRGARNIPCETVPGKRAPTVKLCQSEQNYVPLNEGYNWKGDPNATLSGQPVPDVPPEGPRPTSPPALVAVSGYDPRQVPTSDPTGANTPNPNWPSLPSRTARGSRCCCPGSRDQPWLRCRARQRTPRWPVTRRRPPRDSPARCGPIR